MHHFALQPPQASSVVTDSNRKQPESHLQFWQQLLWGCSSSRGNHWTESTLQPWQRTLPRGCTKRWRRPVIFGSVPPGHPYTGNSELAAEAALKLGRTWQRFVLYCSDLHWKWPTETLGEQLCFQCYEVPNKAALALCIQAAAKRLEINSTTLRRKMYGVMHKVTLIAELQGQHSYMLT